MASVDGIEIEEGVAFGRGADRDLLCDIYTPRSGANDTGVLMFHGGGWSRGDRGSMREPALALAAQGFVTVAPEYRLTTESPWPAQLHDVKAAIRWMRRLPSSGSSRSASERDAARCVNAFMERHA